MKTAIYMAIAAGVAFIVTYMAILLFRPQTSGEDGLGVMMLVAGGAALGALVVRLWQIRTWGS